jgi:hypothetical protein
MDKRTQGKTGHALFKLLEGKDAPDAHNPAPRLDQKAVGKQTAQQTPAAQNKFVHGESHQSQGFRQILINAVFFTVHQAFSLKQERGKDKVEGAKQKGGRNVSSLLPNLGVNSLVFSCMEREKACR